MSRGKWSVATFVAVLVGFASPAWAKADEAVTVEAAAATLSPNQFVWADSAATDPVRVVINVAEQRAYVYRGEALIAATTVSTGKTGKDTPSGTFTILQKKIDHRSNLYDSAPMPFMQRLTWDGIAIHAGKNPGYAASHGCIRVPMAFAKKLYGITGVGTTVQVIGADGELAPMVYDPGTGFAGGTASETADANKAAMQLASK